MTSLYTFSKTSYIPVTFIGKLLTGVHCPYSVVIYIYVSCHDKLTKARQFIHQSKYRVTIYNVYRVLTGWCDLTKLRHVCSKFVILLPWTCPEVMMVSRFDINSSYSNIIKQRKQRKFPKRLQDIRETINTCEPNHYCTHIQPVPDTPCCVVSRPPSVLTSHHL